MSPRFCSNRLNEYLVFGLVCLALNQVGCAHYSTSSRSLPAHIKSIAISLFQNATIENGIIEPLTDAIVAKFVTDNQLRVVDPRDADSIISGTVVAVREESVSFDQAVDTRETRILLIASVRYEDTRRSDIIWEDTEMSSWGVFEIVTGTTEDRNAGIEQAVNRLADDILNKTVAGW